MFIRSPSNEKKTHGQAMVEFALVLPILLLVVYGLLEVGRLLFIYASVTTASRQAVRYASATGGNDFGTPRFKDCSGITAAANSVAFIVDFEKVNITYDRPDSNNPGNIKAIKGMNMDPSVANECPTLAAMPGDVIQNGDRVKVYVDAQYTPIVPLVPLDPFIITAESSRTVIVTISIQVTAPPSTWEASTPTPSSTATKTPTNTPTSSNTPTDTPTQIFTFTPSNTPTNTSTPSDTPTPSNTPTPTNTPTATPTPIICSAFNLSNGPLQITNNTMSMTISNSTGFVLDTAQIFVAWNTSGATNKGELRLNEGDLSGPFWSSAVGEGTSPKVFVPSSSFSMPTIPMGNSSIVFTFTDDYILLDGTETIVITIGTNGCYGFTLTGK
jgi:hypothetical protein